MHLPKTPRAYTPQSNPMDEYRQPTRPDGYKPHRERETPTQFRNEDSGKVYDRSIERVRRALDNYESNRPERQEKEKDLNERLDSEDWHNLDFDEMSQFFKERGSTLSDAERTEFAELMMS